MRSRYNIIVIGGGHAGIEAAWAASRMGADVALVTMDPAAIGRMSCNPAIGGLGKGQLVREIDALGGLMGRATDLAGIQFRMLNRRKGPAVWAPRAQADRDHYPKVVQSLMASAASLEIVQGSVERLLTRATKSSVPQVAGVRLADGRELAADAVIVTTGTFLRGLMHCGDDRTEGGRIGESSAVGLSASLAELGLSLGRLKTGTPPRVHRDSIDYGRVEVQPGDEYPVPFSLMTDAIHQRQMSCWVTWTNPDIHDRIRANLHRAPMYSGQIESTGPRYCPSIEDKVVRFADKDRHQVFLEPEGYDNERVYCNGISTSLPRDVQEGMVRGIAGLEHAEILQYGYAVEYDFVPTHQITTALETKAVGGLFLAGQINGTSGYEEAAGQGLVAGANAVLKLRGEPPFSLTRDQAYIGVMIDDLIAKPPSEPYRMFTSRAEYRLLLRADNADARLTPVGRQLGLVDEARWERFRRRETAVELLKNLAADRRLNGRSVGVVLSRSGATLADVAAALSSSSKEVFCIDAVERLMIDAHYRGYVDRQSRQIERMHRLGGMTIPAGLDFECVTGLRREAVERLSHIRPATLSQAGRISGINPADLTVLWVHLKRFASRASAGSAAATNS